MSCPVLARIADAAASASYLPAPAGLGAQDVLAEQVRVLAGSVAVLQRELAVRMAAWEREATVPADVRGEACRSGLGRSQAAALRRLGVFAREHPALHEAFLAGAVSIDQAEALRRAAAGLPSLALQQRLVELVLPHAPSLTAAQTRQLAAETADRLDPGDPDAEERDDHAARCLVWTEFRGGVSFQGYLPALEGGAFTAAVTALAESLRVQDDGLTRGQRNADGLAALVAAAAAHGLPAGGGLPAAVTLTVSLQEAGRIAAKDPAGHGAAFGARPRGGARIGERHAGEGAVRFGLCCAALTPVLTGRPDPPPGTGGLLARIAATPAEPLAVGRSVRLATAAQRRALQLRDGGCVIEGCGVAAGYTQPHHVTPWSLDGDTDIGNLASLCFAHHRLVELGHWTLVKRRPGDTRPPGALAHPAWWIIPRSRC